MKTIKVKHSLSSGGRLMPQHPGAKLGFFGNCETLAVTGLPDEATFEDAKQVLDNVFMPSWLYTVDASQIGKNLYLAENLTPEQLATAPDWYREKYCPAKYECNH